MIPPYATNHASQVYQLPSGEWLMAWFSGSKEGADDVAIVMARLPQAGTQWSSALVVSRREGYSNQNPVWYHSPETGVLHLFHSQQPAGKGEDNAQVWHVTAADGRGMPGNWSKPGPIFTRPGSFTKNRLIRSLNGTWMLPMYYANGPSSTQFSHIKTSATQGAGSWGNYGFQGTGYLVQPTVVRPVPGKANLVAYFRDRRAQHIYMATSVNDGVTWTEPAVTPLPNNNAGIQANVLSNGHLVMVYNPQTSGRDPLAISLSEDGGMTWKYTRHLEEEQGAGASGDGANGGKEFSYPTVVEGADGRIHVSYTYLRQTIKYCVVTEDWIKAGAKRQLR